MNDVQDIRRAVVVFPTRGDAVLLAHKKQPVAQSHHPTFCGSILYPRNDPMLFAISLAKVQFGIDIYLPEMREWAKLSFFRGGRFAYEVTVVVAKSYAGTPYETADFECPTLYLRPLLAESLAEADKAWILRVVDEKPDRVIEVHYDPQGNFLRLE